MNRMITLLAGLALLAVPALALDPRVPTLALQVVDDGQKATDFAKDHLHPLRLRHLQIRNALANFTHWANELAKDAARPGIDPAIIHHGLRNLETWGGTVDYHLNPSDSPAIEKVRVRWEQTKGIWKALKDAASFRPGNGGQDPRQLRFDALHAAQL